MRLSLVFWSFCKPTDFAKSSCSSRSLATPGRWALAPPRKLKMKIASAPPPRGALCAPEGSGHFRDFSLWLQPPWGGAPAHRRPGDANSSAKILRAFRPPGGAVSPLAPLSTLRSRPCSRGHLKIEAHHRKQRHRTRRNHRTRRHRGWRISWHMMTMTV